MSNNNIKCGNTHTPNLYSVTVAEGNFYACSNHYEEVVEVRDGKLHLRGRFKNELRAYN